MNNFEGFVKIKDTDQFVFEIKLLIDESKFYNEKVYQKAQNQAELLADKEEQRYKEKVLDYMAKDSDRSSQMLRDFEEAHKDSLVKKSKKVSYFVFFEETKELDSYAFHRNLTEKNNYFWTCSLIGELLSDKESKIETPEHHFPFWALKQNTRMRNYGFTIGEKIKLYERNEFVKNITKDLYHEASIINIKRLEQFVNLTGEIYLPISDFNFIQDTRIRINEQV